MRQERGDRRDWRQKRLETEAVLRSRNWCKGRAPAPPQIKQTKFSIISSSYIDKRLFKERILINLKNVNTFKVKITLCSGKNSQHEQEQDRDEKSGSCHKSWLRKPCLTYVINFYTGLAISIQGSRRMAGRHRRWQQQKRARNAAAHHLSKSSLFHGPQVC